MPQTARGKLQDAAVISKTTQTIVGQEIACGAYATITLFFDYVKGDETGVTVYPYVRWASGGQNYQDQSWTSAAGTRSVTANEYYVTASGNYIINIDVRGVQFVSFYQACADGTPTGTLAATYTMTGI